MYLLVPETINQGTPEHRCRYGHQKIKNDCVYIFLTANGL